MRNYVEFWANKITATISLDGTIVSQGFFVVVVGDPDELREKTDEMEFEWKNLNPSPFLPDGPDWYFDESATEGGGAQYLLLNKDNVVAILNADQGFTYQLLTADPQIFTELEGLVVDESPRPTWSHGH